jgi:hypothetical protein
MGRRIHLLGGLDMTSKPGKIYGVFFAVIGLILLFIDTLLLSIETGFLKFSFNPLEIIGRYLDHIVYHSTHAIAMITSSVFIVMSLGFGVAFFVLLQKNMKTQPEKRNWVPVAITGVIAAITWTIHAGLLFEKFQYIYEHRTYLDIVISWNTVFLSIITLLLLVIPSMKAKGLRHILAFALIIISLQSFFDIVYFGLVNVIFKHESAGVIPILSLTAPLFIVAGGICFLEGKQVLMFLEKLDKTFHCSKLLSPLVNLFDGKYETWAISDTIRETTPEGTMPGTPAAALPKDQPLPQTAPNQEAAAPKPGEVSYTPVIFPKGKQVSQSFHFTSDSFSNEKPAQPQERVLRPGNRTVREQIEDVQPLFSDEDEAENMYSEPELLNSDDSFTDKKSKNPDILERSNAGINTSAPQPVRKGLFKSRKNTGGLENEEFQEIREISVPRITKALPERDLFAGEASGFNDPANQSLMGAKQEDPIMNKPIQEFSPQPPERKDSIERITEVIDDYEEPDPFSMPLPEKKSSPVIAIVVVILLLLGISAASWYFLAGPGKSKLESIINKPSPSATPVKAPASPAGIKPSEVLPREAARYSDIEKSPFKNQIINLARLKIFDEPEGEFKPGKPITRAQYIRWLVKANNTFLPAETGGLIQPASGQTKSSFTDIGKKHKDWEWIQGLADAGYDIAFSKGKFAPERKITRQEMINIRCQLEYNMSPKESGKTAKNPKPAITALLKFYDDADKIKPACLAAFIKDKNQGFMIIKSSFGTTRLIKPDKEVTREEAAASISKIKNISAESILENMEK